MRNVSGNQNARADRRPFECIVQVSWLTRTGDVRSVRAKCLDLSSEGARIECAEPLDVRSKIYVQAPNRGVMGDASVRYCIRSGAKYTIGVLFSSASSQADHGRKQLLRESRPARKGYRL